MIEVHFAEKPRRTRGQIQAQVAACDTERITANGPEVIYTDDILLGHSKSRTLFAKAVAERSGNGTVPADIEAKLIQLYTDAQQQLAGDAGETDDDDDDDGSGSGNGGGSPNQATRLVQLAQRQAREFFVTPGGEPYVTVDENGHLITFPIGERGGGFRDWLIRSYYLDQGSAPSSGALVDAMGPLRGAALYTDPPIVHPVHLRVAGDTQCIFIDLGDATWEAIEITATGWRIVSQPPIKFRRPKGLLPLPRPRPGGSLAMLRPFLHFGKGDDAEGQFRRFLAFLLDCFRPWRPHGILCIYGPEGSGKSTVSRIVRELVDPAQQTSLRPPRNERTLFVRASNCAVLTLSNVSGLPEWLSDSLCSIASGEGSAERRLFTDDDECIFDVCRPIIVNGIEEVGTRRDFLDRQIPVECVKFARGTRRKEAKFWADFERVRPQILGVLLDAVVHALQLGEDVDYGALPRLADVSHWAARGATKLGFTAKVVLDEFHEDAGSRHSRVLDASPIVDALRHLLEGTLDHKWEGRVSALLVALNEARVALGEKRPPKDWPPDAHRLSNHLRRIQTSLVAEGIRLEMPRRTNQGQSVVLTWTPPEERKPGDDEEPDPPETPPPGQPEPEAEPEPEGTENPDSPHPEETCNSASPASPASPMAAGCQENGDAQRDAGGDGERHSASRAAAATRSDANQNPASPLASPPASPPEPSTSAKSDASDASDAKSHATSGTSVRETFTSLTSATEVEAALRVLRAAPLVGIDTETSGLDSRRDRIRLVQLATADQTFILDTTSTDPRLLAPLFAGDGPVLAGHNLSFDLQMLQAAGLPCPPAGRLFDTMLAAQLLGASSEHTPHGYYRLEEVAERVIEVGLDKTEQKSRWAEPTLSTEQLAYAARDAAVLVPLTSALQRELTAAGLDRVTGIEMSALPAVAWLEQTGAPFDVDGWAALSDAAVFEQQQVLADINAEAGNTTVAGQTGMFGDTLVNWKSPPQVLAMLRRRGHTVARTDDATLQALAPTEPLAKLLLAYRDATKRAGAFGIAYAQKHVHSVTGRIHAQYLQLGSRAGRMSCIQPNLQQVPHTPAYRACFRPAEGRCLVIADYSQIELRIAAQLSGDKAMLAAYQRGDDLHVTTAAMVLNVAAEAVTKEQRQLAKALNFGLVYGAGSKTLRQHAETNYHVTLSEVQADRYRAGFFRTYRGLLGWQRQYGDEGAIETRTLAGRRRLAVTKFTEKLNTPDQGTGADGFKAALGLLWERRAQCPSATPVNAIHDELVIEVDVDQAEAAKAWAIAAMKDGMQPLIPDVPVVVEAAIGRDWSCKP